jgi:hypothetical protein
MPTMSMLSGMNEYMLSVMSWSDIVHDSYEFCDCHDVNDVPDECDVRGIHEVHDSTISSMSVISMMSVIFI